MQEIEEKRAKMEEEKQREKAAAQELQKRIADEQMAKQNAADSGSSGDASPWLARDIVVKIINKDLAGGKYHKRKGYVKVRGAVTV